MKSLLIKLFISAPDQTSDPVVRSEYGSLSAIVGIVVNVLLVIGKGVIGLLTNSIAIIGDAVNNLSDCGTSIVSLISVKVSKRPADKNHPFGHARAEYIGSTIVSVVIVSIGIELFRTSVAKIINPGTTTFNLWVVVVLCLSIVVKLWLFLFNRSLGTLIDSTVLKAVATDSLNDVLATSVVLISAVISHLTRLELDAYMGIAVAAFVIYSGVDILKEMLSQLMGPAPSSEISRGIEEFILQYDGVIGIHDLVVHDYGPGKVFASVHVEVDAAEDVLKSHDMIDAVEREILDEMGIQLVIHMDPIVLDDPYVNCLYEATADVLREFDDTLEFHDFRVMKGKTHSNLIFDVVVPPCYHTADDEIRKKLQSMIREKTGETIFVVLTVDRSYIARHIGTMR
jgi:cation diffusion facilitator family transporter